MGGYSINDVTKLPADLKGAHPAALGLGGLRLTILALDGGFNNGAKQQT